MARTVKLVRGTGGAAHIKAGNYPAEIVGPKVDRAKGSGKPVITTSIRILDGKNKGTSLAHSWSLQPQAMWRVTEDMVALGLLSDDELEALDAGELELDHKDIVERLDGEKGTVTVFDDTYNGTTRSKIGGFIVESDGDDEEEEEDE